MTQLYTLCDVTFLFGPHHRPIRAHKLILAGSSEVFEKMFFSDFPSQTEIKIDDITRPVFELMLDCIYGRDFDLNVTNMVDVMYAAEKYNLSNLKKFCSSFVVSVIDKENALTILSQFHNFNVIDVNEKCLAMVSDDPVYYLHSEKFGEVDADVVRLIFKQSRLNCSVADMTEACNNWLYHNNLTPVTAVEQKELLAVIEEGLGITQFDFESKKCAANIRYKTKWNYLLTDSIQEEFSKNCIFIHGIGLLMGVKNASIEKEVISITFVAKHEDDSVKILTTIDKIVEKDEPKNCCSVQDVFFEKVLVKFDMDEKLLVQIDYHSQKVRAVYDRLENGKEKQGVISHLIYTEIK